MAFKRVSFDHLIIWCTVGLDKNKQIPVSNLVQRSSWQIFRTSYMKIVVKKWALECSQAKMLTTGDVQRSITEIHHHVLMWVKTKKTKQENFLASSAGVELTTMCVCFLAGYKICFKWTDLVSLTKKLERTQYFFMIM